MEMYRFEWLAKRHEDAIDDQQRIIDPHHHLWDHRAGTYLASELLADTGHSHNVVATVFVECRSKWNAEAPDHLAPVGETRFVAGEAAEMAERGGAQLAAIVSHADLTLGAAVEEVLAAHDKAGAGLFRGIRHSLAWHEDPEPVNSHTKSPEGVVETAEFVEGARTLAAMGFSYDAWLYHTQLDGLVRLAEQVPELTIVIDHLAGPIGVGRYVGKRDEVRADWRQSMSAAAANTNMVLKVGGIGMDNVFGTGWGVLEAPPSSEEVAAYWSDDIRWCIDTFGPDRCMFESNFPVDRQTLPYTVLWNAFQIMADGYTAAEKAQLFAGTAERAYRIEL